VNLDDRRNSRLARAIRYSAVALIAAWSLLALAGYYALGTVSDLLGSVDPAYGWIV
jgi:fatty acid desaturase